MAAKAGFEKVGFRLKCVDYKQSLFCSRIRGEERKIFEARAAKPRVAWAPEGERKGSLSFRAPSGARDSSLEYRAHSVFSVLPRGFSSKKERLLTVYEVRSEMQFFFLTY